MHHPQRPVAFLLVVAERVIRRVRARELGLPAARGDLFADSTVAIWGNLSSIRVQPSMCQSNVARR